MPRACVFCNSTTSKISGEHVIPEWVAGLFPEEEQMTYGIVQGDGSLKDFQARPFQQTVNVVCKPCNTGWMSRLEGAVNPKLGPMIQSARVTRLTPRTQKLLAAWAVKTALMLEHLHPAPRIIPESEYPRLYAEQQPPRGYLVFLSRWSPEIDARRKALVVSRTSRVNEFSVRSDATEEEIRETRKRADLFFSGTYTLFQVMFAIGHAAFAVIGHNAPMTLGFNVGPGLQNVAQRIWPREHSVTWPPKTALGGAGLLGDFFASREQDPPT